MQLTAYYEVLSTPSVDDKSAMRQKQMDRFCIDEKQKMILFPEIMSPQAEMYPYVGAPGLQINRNEATAVYCLVLVGAPGLQINRNAVHCCVLSSST